MYCCKCVMIRLVLIFWRITILLCCESALWLLLVGCHGYVWVHDWPRHSGSDRDAGNQGRRWEVSRTVTSHSFHHHLPQSLFPSPIPPAYLSLPLCLPLSPHPFQPTPSFPCFLSSSLLHSHPLGLSSFSSRTHINVWSASSTGEDLLSLLYHFLDEWLFLFSADPFFIPRVRGN